MTINLTKWIEQFGRVKNQFLATFIANLATYSTGLIMGWLSPALLILQSNDTPLTSGPVTVEESSWLGSLVFLGSISGYIFNSGLAKTYGRKLMLALQVFPNVIYWLLIMFGDNIYYLYAGRFICGLVLGANLTCIPLIVAEISDDKVRGILGGFMAVMQYGGIWTGYIIGGLTPYHVIPFIMIPFPIIFLISFLLCVPETPYFLLKMNKRECAEESLRFYKNCGSATKEDLERFTVEMNKLLSYYEKMNQPSSCTNFSIGKFITKPVICGFLKGIALATMNAYCSSVVLMNYGANIFRDSGSTFDPNTSTVIMGSVQLLGTISALFFIDKFGRRFLLVISTVGCAMGLSGLGAFNYLVEHNNFDMEDYSWVPVTSISIGLFFSCIGIIPVTVILIIELLPAEVRDCGAMILLSLLSGLQFSAVKLFPIIAEWYGMYTGMWFFAGVCILGTFFTLFLLKETKGKSIN